MVFLHTMLPWIDVALSKPKRHYEGPCEVLDVQGGFELHAGSGESKANQTGTKVWRHILTRRSPSQPKKMLKAIFFTVANNLGDERPKMVGL